MRGELWIYCEVHHTVLSPDSLALLSYSAARLNQQAATAAVVIGCCPEHVAAKLYAAGAERVYGCSCEAPVSERQAALTLKELVQEHQPFAVLFSSTVIGKSVAAQTAALLGTGLTSGCTGLSLRADGLLSQIRPSYEGCILAEIICPEKRPQMATVRTGLFPTPVLDYTRSGEFLPVHPSNCQSNLRTLRRMPLPQAASLSQAKIVVAGGVGIGSSDNFNRLRHFAYDIGAAIGASRGAVNAGYARAEYQIGQSGSIIHPKLYLAFAISGAVQHLSGISHADYIVAVNSDPHAPILAHADLALVCDWKEGLEAIAAQYKITK